VFGATVEEKIVELKEGKSIKIDIYEKKNLPLMGKSVGEFKVREENGKTILYGTLEYEMLGTLGDMVNALMLKRVNTKNWNSVLAGFKKHIETGEIVGKDTKLDLDAVKII